MRKTDDPLFYALINLEEDLEFHRRLEKGDVMDPTGFDTLPDHSEEVGRRNRPPLGSWPNDASQSRRKWTRKALADLNARIVLLAVTTHSGRPMSIAVKLGIDATYVRRVLNELP